MRCVGYIYVVLVTATQIAAIKIIINDNYTLSYCQ